ncbi:MAG: helix-turn-helix domain-containing protein [Verrucomicrobiia bacterium]
MNPAPPTFRATLMDLNRPEPPLIPRTPQIQGATRDFALVETAVAQAFNLPVEALHDRSRINAHAWPRQVAYYLLREFTRANNCEIGRHFGRTHSTIVKALTHVTDLMDVYPKVRAELDAIRQTINQRIAEAA